MCADIIPLACVYNNKIFCFEGWRDFGFGSIATFEITATFIIHIYINIYVLVMFDVSWVPFSFCASLKYTEETLMELHKMSLGYLVK